jgi:L-threonylcarbamoyladenylate synthase
MDSALLDVAAERVRDGALVAYPTETVWGLGADAGSEQALEGLRSWKGRADDAPISILVSGPDALEALGFVPCASALALAKRFWPGPLTLVLRCERRFAKGVARHDGAVGVRCSSHPVAAELAMRVQALGVGPLTSTSLNQSGMPHARTLREARSACERPTREAPPLLVDAGPDADGANPSTVLDLTGADALVLRWGALEERDLAPVLQEIIPS